MRVVDSANLREARDGLVRYWMLAAVYLAMAGLCAPGIRYAHSMAHGSRVYTAEARVVAIETIPEGQRQILVARFLDRDGREQEIRDTLDSGTPKSVGDEVTVIYNPRDLRYSSIASTGDFVFRGLFVGMTLFFLALSAGFALAGVLIRRKRHWLLRHGKPERGEAVKVEWFNYPGAPAAAWRVRASWLHPETATWHEVTSPWQDSARWAPALEGKDIEVRIDPRRPRRAWIVLSPLRVPSATAAKAASA